jgi:hypothetical protein
VFATLVAVTLQEDTAAGAVYNPLVVIVPQVVDHATEVFVLPVTVAENCSVVDTDIVAEVGLIVTATTGGGGAACMVMVNVAVPVPKLLLAEIVTTGFATTLGVPDISPVVVLIKAQDGRPVAA